MIDTACLNIPKAGLFRIATLVSRTSTCFSAHNPSPVLHLSFSCPLPVLHLSFTCPSPVLELSSPVFHLFFTCSAPNPSHALPTALAMSPDNSLFEKLQGGLHPVRKAACLQYVKVVHLVLRGAACSAARQCI